MQDSGGTVTEDIGDDLRNESCLPVEAVENLGKVAIKIEEFYRSARDIEWGILNDNLYIFQSSVTKRNKKQTMKLNTNSMHR
ncbi:hypothetical protein CEXT_418371 [Caerostris extrusa]|uniref:Pyruvate phosphate dikinase AMP/ATP-binding domain-containing protein n=1 Tax=Caerostris extrusa TaxID=172846 RepID=A0AAV4SYC0_CAEEX|nr:hypothetical protein CEXT_418371 [Caerostris extrusa]